MPIHDKCAIDTRGRRKMNKSHSDQPKMLAAALSSNWTGDQEMNQIIFISPNLQLKVHSAC